MDLGQVLADVKSELAYLADEALADLGDLSVLLGQKVGSGAHSTNQLLETAKASTPNVTTQAQITAVQQTIAKAAGQVQALTPATSTTPPVTTPPVTTPPVTTPPVVTPPAGSSPFVTPGQLPAGLTLPTGLKLNAVFNSTSPPPSFSEGWYDNAYPYQNATNMVPANVAWTPNGLELSVDAAAKTGGLVTSDTESGSPGFLFRCNTPTVYQIAAIPATTGAGLLADWQELWVTTINNWLGETDLMESLSGSKIAAAHVHDNEGSIVPGGIDYGLTPGEVATYTCLHLPNGVRYFFLNGAYKGSMQGQSDAAMGSPWWMFVLGDSIQPGGPLIGGTVLVKSAMCWQ